MENLMKESEDTTKKHKQKKSNNFIFIRPKNIEASAIDIVLCVKLKLVG